MSASLLTNSPTIPEHHHSLFFILSSFFPHCFSPITVLILLPKIIITIISRSSINLPFHPPTMVLSGDPYFESFTGLILKRIPVRLVIRSARS